MMNTQSDSLQSPNGDDEEISLLELGIVLARRKRLVMGFPVAVAVLAVGVSLLMPNVYTATTRILPPQQAQSGASAMLAQLGGLAGVVGGGVGIKSPGELYVSMLKSRTVTDNLVRRFELQAYYKEEFASDAGKVLDGQTRIAAGMKDGIISIEVDDKDPKRAAEIANGYVDELYKLTKVLAVTEASQRRLFFEQQLAQAKDNLARAEIAAKQAMERGGLANVDAQGRTLLETTARLRAQAAVKEVQIGAMRAYAGERNPSLLMAQQELAVLKSELAKIEGSGGGRDPASTATSGFDNLRLLRDVKYYEVVYEMLAKQFEIAKIDEAKEGAVIQVIDKAVEPERKSKPKRALIVILATLAAGFVGILIAFVLEGIEKAKGDPTTSQRLNDLRRHLAWRR